jgi:tRNA A37 threonylcarbamoyladenosine modification protein TsaB
MLVLDGSLGFGIVAIVEERDGVPVCVAENYLYEQPILQRINNLIPDQEERSALTSVVVGTGPGSYSGIRVAASAAVGIAAALALPLRESASDRALWQAAQRPFSIALGTRESLEVSEAGALIVVRETASPHFAQEESRGVAACALVNAAGPAVKQITLRYPAPARGSEAHG